MNRVHGVVLDVEPAAANAAACPFCAIARGEAPAVIVLDEPAGVAFLDRRPVRRGHVLLAPRQHFPTLPDLPVAAIGPFFALVQRLARAVPRSTDADGSFVAVNNIVSQSVPHLHVHVVPRRHDDRLFSRNLAWTRQPYRGTDDMEEMGARIRETLALDNVR